MTPQHQNEQWISPYWQAEVAPNHCFVGAYPLKPLTIWHTFALDNTDNVFWHGGKITLIEIAQLVWTCGMTRKQYLRAFRSPAKMQRQVNNLAKRLSLFRLDQLATESNAYVRDSLRLPERWTSGKGKACAVPVQLHLVAFAESQGIPFDKAWDMSYARMRCRYDAWAEMQGDDKIMSREAQQMAEEWREKGITP
jgi:hypothetical protein